MKRIIGIILILSLMLVVGCRTGKTTKELEEALESVDWDKAIVETIEELMDPENFDYVKDIYIEVDDEKNEISVTTAVSDSTHKDTAVEFADIIIRKLSSNVSGQNNKIKGPEDNYLGELYDFYDIAIGIAPMGEADKRENWHVLDEIKSGVHRSPRPNSL